MGTISGKKPLLRMWWIGLMLCLSAQGAALLVGTFGVGPRQNSKMKGGGCEDRMGESWSSETALTLPPDPTLSFLGEQWWKLPGAIMATLAVMWVLLKYLGISQVLLQLMSK